MTIAEQIYTLVQALPEEQAAEILTFVEFVQNKHENKTVGLPSNAMPWPELVESLAGAWEDDFPTLEAIRSGASQDVRRESL